MADYNNKEPSKMDFWIIFVIMWIFWLGITPRVDTLRPASVTNSLLVVVVTKISDILPHSIKEVKQMLQEYFEKGKYSNVKIRGP